MATLASNNPTLLDLAKASDPDGKIATVIEILNETNPILEDMSWVEGNLPTGHLTTIRSGIPAPTWRKMYQFVQPTKATTVQVTENTGMMEAYGEIDKALADLNGNTAAFRLLEDRAHIEGMNQEMADTLFFGNEDTEAEAFTGFAPRYNDLSAESADNIIDGAGTGTDNASIWLVIWGDSTVHGLIPKGSVAGMQVEDLGRQTLTTTAGNMEIYRSHYRWDAGLSVKDWRFVVRICNIDKSDLVKDAATGADLPDLMFQALDIPPSLTMGRPVFYMNRTLLTFLRRQSANAVSNSTLTIEMLGGVPVTSFHGVPIRRIDALAADEARVT